MSTFNKHHRYIKSEMASGPLKAQDTIQIQVMSKTNVYFYYSQNIFLLN